MSHIIFPTKLNQCCPLHLHRNIIATTRRSTITIKGTVISLWCWRNFKMTSPPTTTHCTKRISNRINNVEGKARGNFIRAISNVTLLGKTCQWNWAPALTFSTKQATMVMATGANNHWMKPLIMRSQSFGNPRWTLLEVDSDTSEGEKSRLSTTTTKIIEAAFSCSLPNEKRCHKEETAGTRHTLHQVPQAGQHCTIQASKISQRCWPCLSPHSDSGPGCS